MTEIEKAKAILREAGYFVENLWHISDVQKDFVCTDAEAYSILYEALTNGYNVDQIFESISEEASLDYQRINDEEGEI